MLPSVETSTVTTPVPRADVVTVWIAHATASRTAVPAERPVPPGGPPSRRPRSLPRSRVSTTSAMGVSSAISVTRSIILRLVGYPPLMASTTRERILGTTAALFVRYGYTGTGLEQIVAAANAPFGSVYHHSPAARPSSARR